MGSAAFSVDTCWEATFSQPRSGPDRVFRLLAQWPSPYFLSATWRHSPSCARHQLPLCWANKNLNHSWLCLRVLCNTELIPKTQDQNSKPDLYTQCLSSPRSPLSWVILQDCSYSFPANMTYLMNFFLSFEMGILFWKLTSIGCTLEPWLIHVRCCGYKDE